MFYWLLVNIVLNGLFMAAILIYAVLGRDEDAWLQKAGVVNASSWLLMGVVWTCL